MSYTVSHYRRLLALGGVALFHTNVTIYLFKHPVGIAIEPFLWVLAFCAASLPLLLQQDTQRRILDTPLLWWCAGFVWVSIVWFFVGAQLPTNWDDLKWRVAAVVQVVCFLLVFQDPAARRCGQWALIASVIVGVGFHIYELLFPLSMNENYGRSAGLYENPNRASEALVLGMIVGLSILPMSWRAPFLLCAGVGVALTLSRSGVLLWVMASGLLAWQGVVRVRPMPLLLAGGAVVSMVAFTSLDVVLLSGEQSGIYTRSIPDRLAMFANPTGSLEDDRVALAQAAWNRFAERPLLGHGTGFAAESASRFDEQQAHNLYLTYMQDHGLMGAALLPLLIVALTYRAAPSVRGTALAFACTLLVLGFFSHTILHGRHVLLLFPLMALLDEPVRAAAVGHVYLRQSLQAAPSSASRALL